MRRRVNKLMVSKIFRFWLLVFALLAGNGLQAQNLLRLVTTTSTENSGLSDYLLKAFKQATNIDVQLVAVGTGKAMAIARNGDADVILVHARAAEDDFINQGYGIERHEVMYNDFVLIGSANDPASVASSTSISMALKRIAQHKSLFISRGDDSGTHKKELGLWAQTAVEPNQAWYRETGQGMGKTLRIADELNAYTLTDRGTLLAQQVNSPLALQVLFEGDEQLFNPYGIIIVNPQKHPQVNVQAARQLVKWITSAPAQKLINDFRINGQRLFIASAKTQ